MGAFLLPKIPLTPQNNCGSEPARESGVSLTMMSTATPPSRAGSLPQGIIVLSGYALITRATLEVALVLTTELRRTLIPHPMRHLRHAQPFGDQQGLRLEQA